MNVKSEVIIEITLSYEEAHDIFHDLGTVRGRSESSDKLMDEFEPELSNADYDTVRKYA